MALCNQKRYNLDFEVYGEGFPSGREDAGRIGFSSRVAQTMYVDYNDGSPVEQYRMNADKWCHIYTYNYTGEYSSTENQESLPAGVSLKFKGREYLDGKSDDRLVSISFDNPAEIIRFSQYLLFHMKGVFAENILRYTNLLEFGISYAPYLTSLPEDLITLTNITSLSLNSNFYGTDSKYMYDYIPIGFFNLQLTALNVANVRLGESIASGKIHNLDKIYLLKDTLINLHIEGCRLYDDRLPTYVTDRILECTNIRGLGIDSNKQTKPPAFINQMTGLTWLRVGGGYSYDSDFVDWGDLSNLVNMRVFNCPVALNAPTTIPPYMKDMIQCTRFDFSGTYDTQERWDEWIDNLYAYVEQHALKDSDDSKVDTACRNCYVSNARFSAKYIVQGTYQQPIGYIENVSNGTPTSQLEKIWVLQNQYNVTVEYKDNRP